MTNDEGNPNDERQKSWRTRFRASCFVINSSFVIRASSLFSSSPHARHVREAEESAQNFLAWHIFDLSDTNRISYIEAPGFYSPQRLQVRATA